MLDALQFLAGLVLLALVFFDFVQTAIGTAGVGPISKRIARQVWKNSRRMVPVVNRATGWYSQRAVGPTVLCAVAAGWVLMSWGSYSMLFAVDGAVALPDGGRPGTAETIAFAGASLSTLGSSLARSGSGWWDMLSAVAAINGMVMLTLSVSFMMNVWQSTAEIRSLALRISAIHARAGDLSEDELASALAALGTAFGSVVVAIRGLPIVAYFATENDRMDFPLAVARLCDLVERTGSGRSSPGYAELRFAMAELAALERELGAGTGDLAVLRDWAKTHRIAC